MNVGFVIRLKSDEHFVGFAIQSIIDVFGELTPIVIVDNDADDETIDIINMFPKKFYNISRIIISKQNYTPGLALNMGISMLKTCDIAGILSSHCQMHAGQQMHKIIEDAFTDTDCVAVFGKQEPVYRGKRINKRYVWANFLHNVAIKNPIENGFDDRVFFHNAFSFVRISYWRNNIFDEDLAGKEDRFWATRAAKLGRYVLFEPSITCVHHWTKSGATWRGMG